MICNSESRSSSFVVPRSKLQSWAVSEFATSFISQTSGHAKLYCLFLREAASSVQTWQVVLRRDKQILTLVSGRLVHPVSVRKPRNVSVGGKTPTVIKRYNLHIIPLI